MADDFSPHEAADRLLCAEATIRRRVASGDLEAVVGPGPLRISRATVEAEQSVMLRRMGVAVPVPQEVLPRAETPGEAEVARLRAKVRDLQGAIADLAAANSAMLDTYRRLSEGSIPND